MEERRPSQPHPRQSRSGDAARPPQPRRRRRTRKPPVKALAMCAGLIFLVGFLLGFLIRGFFLPEAEEPSRPEQPVPSGNVDTPPESTGAVQSEPSQRTPDWRLVLVNEEHPLTQAYSVELTRLSGGVEVDKRCYSDLQNLLSDCKAAGFSPTIVTGFVGAEVQHDACGAARPEADEHRTGLAVDIVDAMNQNLDGSQNGSAIGAWLAENSWRYGFIQRYPESALWHYRYVGAEAAKDIHDQGLTLEEYLAALAGGIG